jgi:hypothetical protein
MPRYFFDIKNGHRLIDPAGLDCRDEREANAQAISLAQAVAAVVPNVAGVRRIVVLNSQREEIRIVPIERREINMAVNKPVGDNARKGAVKKRSLLQIKAMGR